MFRRTCARIKQGISLLVLHQNPLQYHLIEKGKLHISDADVAMQVARKFAGNLRDQPILNGAV